MKVRILLVALALAVLSACSGSPPGGLVAGANSTPGFVNGQVPSYTQWNGFFGGKADATNGQLTNPAITGGTIDGACIGCTTPAAGKFTSLSASTGLLGVSTNSSAGAGYVGEYVSSIAYNFVNNLSSGVTADVTSISLSAGDWTVCAEATISTITIASGITAIRAWLTTTSASDPGIPNGGAYVSQTLASVGPPQTLPVGCQQLLLSGTTTVYLDVNVTFASGGLGKSGFIGARRMH